MPIGDPWPTFWPMVSAPLPPDSTHQWQVPMAPIQTQEDIRARAYQMARDEMPEWSSRAEVMAAADEIFEYLRFGTKPEPKAS